METAMLVRAALGFACLLSLDLPAQEEQAPAPARIELVVGKAGALPSNRFATTKGRRSGLSSVG
jgi:hypothetical protein